VSDGRKALVFSAVLIFPLFLVFLLVGALLWVFYQSHPFQIPLPEGRPGIKSVDFVFPIFILTETPHILKGFLIVAILSAAMSSISSALTSLASVSTMDFVKPLLPNRSERSFLNFSKLSTIGWAAVLVGVAWLTREVQFVLNAAFSLRGLTSGALLGGIILALFARGVGARAAMLGMSASVLAMNLLYWPPNLTAWPGLRTWWLATFGGEIFWPWFTLIGTLITLGVAWATRRRGTNADPDRRDVVAAGPDAR
jgi:Na+/proline symporter